MKIVMTGDVGVEDSMKRARAVVEDTGDVLNVRYKNLRTLQEAEDARVTAAVVAVMVGLVTMVEEADAKRRAEEAARLAKLASVGCTPVSVGCGVHQSGVPRCHHRLR